MELEQIIGRAGKCNRFLTQRQFDSSLQERLRGRQAIKIPSCWQEKKMEERREKVMPFKLAWGSDAWLASNHVVRTETL